MNQRMSVRLAGAIIGIAWTIATFAGVGARADTPTVADLTKLQDELKATETAFAKTMADRDVKAFGAFIADEAVFFGRAELRGREAIVTAWAGFFEGPDAPFSWQPDVAVVLQSGGLGLTSGPVFNPAGERTGTFNSTWRREADGHWKIVFDKGCPPCGSR